DNILHLLRLGEARNLRAEILRPVRPAQAPPRDWAAAQVDRLEAGRINEYFCERLGSGQPTDLAAPKFEGDSLRRVSVFAALVEIGAQRGVHYGQQVAEDAILIEYGYFIERCLDACRYPRSFR